jgi:membrane protease YdiL (CAAX protease family)
MRKNHLPRGLAALLETAILFLPAIPAYLWLWPNVSGVWQEAAQSLVYLYVLAGSLFIGLRRWNIGELGFNRQGIGLSLACGALLIAGRTLVILAVDWHADPSQPGIGRLLWELLFYFGLVALSEELLFRGLIYRAFDDWIGVKWAVWGSSLAFMLWHIFGQGPLVGLAMLFYGLVFALMRLRAGGIVGLILVHGLIDFSAARLMPDVDVLSLGRPDVPRPLWLILGLGLILAVPILLWKGFPRSNQPS